MIEIRLLDPTDTLQANSAWECYRLGYAAHPWFETWDEAQIAQDILGSLRDDDGVCFVAQTNGIVIGLTLGYVIPGLTLRDRLELPNANGPLARDETVAYQDELVVRPEWWGRGVGRLLYERWFQWAITQQQRDIIARTLAEPPTIVYDWYRNRLGYHVIAQYPDPDQRVILHHQRAL